ncbi:MAG: NAD(P)-dependent oxidoreductase [Thermoproteota archaeon]|nr:NAD(P)-dependent oxidoreductase [Thermoproteota archaeon]
MVEKVLITGGAGYIGSVLTRALLDEGFAVTVLDRFIYGQNSLLDCCINENFSIIRADVRDRGALAKAMNGADFIIHLAALVGAPLCDSDPIAATTTNLDGTNLLLSLRSPCQKLLFPCTNSGYGIGEKNKFCTEETPLRPISLYGKTKVAAEKAILESGDSISFRLATVFGVSPRMRTDLLVNNFVYRALNDGYLIIFEGHFKRNYIHINDVARAFLHAINNFESMKNQVYNVGLSDANLSKLELCDQIKKHIPSLVYVESAVGEDPDKRDYLVSNEKIEQAGFNPQYSIDDGIVQLMKAYSILKNTNYSNF